MVTLQQQHSVNIIISVGLCMLQVVSVTFDDLSLEYHANCSSDSVSLYDGRNAISKSLGKFCTSATSSITTSGSSLFVVFKTDYSVNAGRFSLNWVFFSEAGLFYVYYFVSTLCVVLAVDFVAHCLALLFRKIPAGKM